LAGCAVQSSVAAEPYDASAATASTATVILPDSSLLTARLKKVSTKGIAKTSLVITTPEGTELSNRSGTKPFTPASTMKLMTTMAAVDILTADTTFATKVVSTSGGIVLVGGGDPLLTDATSKSPYKKASLASLAKKTATALKAAGRKKVKLGYDASLFSGPTFSPHWKSSWLGYEARVTALEINSGLVNSWRAASNPSLTAAKAFAKRLKAAGITVTSVTSAKAASSNTELARVTSAKLAMIIKRTLLISDNVGAETISRHAAIASHRAGSFSGAAATVTAWLTKNGLWVSGQKILDGSGLAPTNKLTTVALAKAMRTALADDTYAAVIAGLPVAHESGTLATRFDDKSEKAGRHNVHAKTGTLRGVAGLVGYLTTSEGARLVFAELANSKTTISYNTLYNWLDRTAAATITCACH